MLCALLWLLCVCARARVSARLFLFALKSRLDMVCHDLCRCSRELHIQSVVWHAMRIVMGASALPQRVTRSSCGASSTLRSNMFAVIGTKVEDLHVDGMCSSITSSSNTSEAAAEVEDERGGGMCSSCTSRVNTSAAATHFKGVRAAENLCAMASART